jgi:hypothetical protein
MACLYLLPLHAHNDLSVARPLGGALLELTPREALVVEGEMVPFRCSYASDEPLALRYDEEHSGAADPE